MSATPIICADVEASGPVPGLGDLISFGAVVVEEGLTRRFASGIMRPECPLYDPATYQLLGLTRAAHEAAPISIADGIHAFAAFIDAVLVGTNKDRCIILSDNPAFDFAWLNYHMLHKVGRPLLGHSARRIGDAWSGLRRRPRETNSWRRFRVTPHDHDPLNDAVANAEAWLEMWRQFG